MKIIALYDNYEPQQFDGKVYLMADSSLAKSGKPWFLPEFALEFTYHTHLVIRIGRLGKNIARRFAHRYVDAVTVGATVTACGIADNAIAKAFDGAAMIGDFLPIEQISDLNEINASLANGDIVTTYQSSQMACHIDEIIEYVSKYFTLKIGDIIYTGFGDSSTPLAIGQHLTGSINGENVLDIKIK